MIGQPMAVQSDLAHFFVHPGMVVSFSTFVAHPGGDILNDDKSFTMSEILPFLPRG